MRTIIYYFTGKTQAIISHRAKEPGETERIPVPKAVQHGSILADPGITPAEMLHKRGNWS